jgi:hypothetical protein
MVLGERTKCEAVKTIRMLYAASLDDEQNEEIRQQLNVANIINSS